MIKSITIITGQHLVSNPRVWKEANALSDFGYNVTIYTTWFSELHINEDKELINSTVSYCPSISIIQKHISKFHLLYAKSIKKIANLIYILFKIDSIYQLLYLPNIQLKNIKKKKSDLFICHQEAGLLLGVQLLKIGARVAFDLEDWYSQDYLKQSRPVNLLEKAESYAIRHGAFITCTSNSMSDALSKHYNTKNAIETIYNSFPESSDVETEVTKIPNSLVWFSQHLGSDRGLEPFLDSIKLITKPLQIHLIGQIKAIYKLSLEKLLSNTPHTLFFHPLLSHHELMKFIQKFEIGLALELNYPLSRNLTITNKILTYLQMGLRVIASNTIGQLELKDDFDNHILYVDLSNSSDIAIKIEQTLFSINNASLLNIQAKYEWEEQAKKIQKLVDESVSI